MDVLADILDHTGVRSTLGARIAAGSDWGSWVEPAAPNAALHAVTSGTAWFAHAGDAIFERDPPEDGRGAERGSRSQAEQDAGPFAGQEAPP